MANRRRVVITGLGVIAPNGIGKQAFWDALLAGKSGVDWIRSFDASRYPCKVAGEVHDFVPTDFMPIKTARRISRCSQLALAATRLALHDAGIESPSCRGLRTGICFGTSASGIADIGEDNHRRFLAGRTDLNPLAMLEYPAHATTSHIAEAFSISGPSTTISSGCATGLDAIAWGMSEIQNGRLNVAIVGAADAPVTEFIFSLFCAGRFLASWDDGPTRASRPYDLLRSGLVLAEAGVTIVLEDLELAVARGHLPYAELLGAGNASEGGFAGGSFRIYQHALETALRNALRSAGVLPSHIDHVNSHGNSTKNDDAAETAAYKGVLGSHAYKVSITSIKGALGQPLAAGGALQLASAAMSIRHNLVPPTINQEVPDPDCDLDYVPNHARVARIRLALVHSHSLGGVVPGSHTAMVLGDLAALNRTGFSWSPV